MDSLALLLGVTDRCLPLPQGTCHRPDLRGPARGLHRRAAGGACPDRAPWLAERLLRLWWCRPALDSLVGAAHGRLCRQGPGRGADPRDRAGGPRPGPAAAAGARDPVEVLPAQRPRPGAHVHALLPGQQAPLPASSTLSARLTRLRLPTALLCRTGSTTRRWPGCPPTLVICCTWT